MAFKFITHSGAERVTLEQLRQLPEPIAMGARHKPVPHWQIVEAAEAEFARQGVELTASEYAVGNEGKILFAAWDTNLVSYDGTRSFSAIMRGSQNERFAHHFLGGSNCFICDNLALSAEMILLHKKSTLFLNIQQQMTNAIQRLLHMRQVEEAETARRKAYALTDERAKSLLFDVFANDLAPVRLLEPVAKCLFSDSAFRRDFGTPDGSHSLYSVQNGITEGCKVLRVTPKVDTLMAIDATFRKIQ